MNDDSPAIDWTRMHFGICPQCREDKFVGHGPLCIDCFTAPTDDRDRR